MGGVFGNQSRGGGIFSNSLGEYFSSGVGEYFEAGARPVAMGASASDAFLPWKEYSAETLAAQRSLNQGLKADGYCPIDEDGKLGAATCGAARQQWGGGGIENCQAYTAPVKCPGGAPPASSSPPAATTAPSSSTPQVVTKAGMSSGTMMLAAGLGVVAIGAFLVAKKKKRRR
jgi:LPXTG-motif cell wall-anchored protein